MEKIIIARWESLRGKYWVDLWKDEYGYGYQADGAGGHFGKLATDNEAIIKIESRLQYLFPGQSKRIK